MNPPCVVSAGCVTAVETQLIKEDMAPPASDSSHSATTRAKKGSRQRKSELSACLEHFAEEANKRRKDITEHLQALVHEEKRKNDLSEKFLQTLNKQKAFSAQLKIHVRNVR